MGRRLKQIKRNDLGESGKKVIDSLINTSVKIVSKEETHELMRCKVEILIGVTKKSLVDSFIVNTTSLSKTINDIVEKYDINVQFIITNLYDEKTVAKRLVFVGGGNREKEDKEHFNHHMDYVRRIHALRDLGMSEEDTCNKVCSAIARSYISKIYKMTWEQAIQDARDMYDNQSLNKSPQSEVISEDLNTKKDIINTIDDKEIGDDLDEE